MAWIRNWHKYGSSRGKMLAVKLANVQWSQARDVGDDSWHTIITLKLSRVQQGGMQELDVELHNKDIKKVIMQTMLNVVILPNCPIHQIIEDINNSDDLERREELRALALNNHGVTLPTYLYVGWHSIVTCSRCEKEWRELGTKIDNVL